VVLGLPKDVRKLLDVLSESDLDRAQTVLFIERENLCLGMSVYVSVLYNEMTYVYVSVEYN